MVKSGRKAARIISVENRIAELDLYGGDINQPYAQQHILVFGPRTGKGRRPSQQLFTFPRLEDAEYVLHQNNGRIDNNPEVDGAKREKIRIFSAEHDYDNTKKQCKGYVDRDNNSTS